MDFPRLDSADIIAVDCETYDPDLTEKGVGAVRDGYIVGVAIATRDQQWYFPVAHEGGGNYDRAQVFRWLNDALSTDIPKVGANLAYDVTYLWSEGVQIQGPFYDIQVAEPLLDENKFSYSLETLSQERLGVGKDEAAMCEYIRQHFGAKEGKEKGYIWKCPAHIVAPYAKQDVALPIQIFDQQFKELREQELEDLFMMETELLPILVRMHLNGVRVDSTYADQLSVEWAKHLQQLEHQFKGINPGSGKDLARYLDSIGVEYPRHKPTAAMLAKGVDTGNPKLDAKVLEALEERAPLLKTIAEAKRYRHFLNTFINGYIVNSHINGRVHGTFNQLKGDEYGTVTGRLSASKPNLQNIPNPEKDPYFSSKCRGMFLPEVGQEWLRYDFSQIEYRLLVHFANTLEGGSADLAVAMYHDDPTTDFHQMCADLTGVTRKQAKNINFGLVYGMGVDKLAASLGLSKIEAQSVFKLYHSKAPFAKAFGEAASQRAAKRGYITTIGKRRRRFDSWESAKWLPKDKRIDGEVYTLKDRQEAVDRWGAVRRAGTHKAGNAVLQGSSADITKKAMVEGYKRGIYDVLGFPLVTVHDELGFSVETGDPRHEEAAREMKEIMETVYKLAVPVLVSDGRGKSWGEAG